MKAIIAGGRDFMDFNLLMEKCDSILSQYEEVEIVSGEARGADKMGEHYASLKKFEVKKFPANWSKHGKSAGHIRNKEMAEYGEMLIAFWDGSSRGTENMIQLAKSRGLITHVFNYTK